MDMKGFLISKKLGGFIKLSSPHFLAFWNSLTKLLMKGNG